MAKAMHALAKPRVIIRFRSDEAIERIHHPTLAHHDDPYAAHTAATSVGRLEVYCCEIIHNFEINGSTESKNGTIRKGIHRRKV